MINTLIKTLQIDISYSVNSFIYIFKRLPIIEDLFTEEAYKNKLVKKVISIIQILTAIFKKTLLKGFYFYFIHILSTINGKTTINSFIHIYFFLTILGMFINNNLLRTSTKKYYSLILFNIDGDKVLKSTLLWNTIINSIYNFIYIYIFTSNLFYTLMLLILTINMRFIGEYLNILFYKKYKYLWYSNNKMLVSVILILLLVSLLPCINIIISMRLIVLLTIIISILGIISLTLLLKIKDYKSMYKRISNKTEVMDPNSQNAYLNQAKYEVSSKDKEIDKNIIKNKKGYDLFNTIFYQRHKEILLRSAKKYSLISAIIYIGIIFLMLKYPNYNKNIGELLHLKLSIFIIIMFYFNRGEIVTKAMFYNCDHAMLNYNFYKEPKVILGLFKRRLITLIKINLLPALVIGIGNISLLLISKNTYTIMTIVTTFLFIICLSILFSEHYLVIYYLLQPYNKNMQLKKPSYTIVTILTYIMTYRLSNLVLSSELLSIIGIIFTIVYSIIAMILIYKVSPKTFKLN